MGLAVTYCVASLLAGLVLMAAARMASDWLSHRGDIQSQEARDE